MWRKASGEFGDETSIQLRHELCLGANVAHGGPRQGEPSSHPPPPVHVTHRRAAVLSPN